MNEEYIRDMKRIKVHWPALTWTLGLIKAIYDWVWDSADYGGYLVNSFIFGIFWAFAPSLVPLGLIFTDKWNCPVYWHNGPEWPLISTFIGVAPFFILLLIGFLSVIMPTIIYGIFKGIKKTPLIPGLLTKLFKAFIPRIEVETIPVNKEEIAKLEQELGVK